MASWLPDSTEETDGIEDGTFSAINLQTNKISGRKANEQTNKKNRKVVKSVLKCFHPTASDAGLTSGSEEEINVENARKEGERKRVKRENQGVFPTWIGVVVEEEKKDGEGNRASKDASEALNIPGERHWKFQFGTEQNNKSVSVRKHQKTLSHVD